MAGKTQTAAMLEALSDGRRWSTHELVEYGAGYAAHSRAADLRKLGYSVKSARRNVPHEKNAVYFYELQRVPVEASRAEQLVEPAAAARLQAMRVQQGDSIFQHPTAVVRGDSEKASHDVEEPGASQPSSADRAGGPGVTEALTPQPAAATPTPLAAAGPLPPQTASWVEELQKELRDIDDEISHLRSQLFLAPEDSARIDLLLARGAEVQERLDELVGQERAA